MPRAVGKRTRARPFSPAESTQLVALVRPLYAKLYGSHSEQVDPPAKRKLWKGIARRLPIPTGGVRRHRSAARKRWDDLNKWAKQVAEGLLGLSQPSGRAVGRKMTPLLEQALAVAHPELAVGLRKLQSTGETPETGEGDEASGVGTSAGPSGSGFTTSDTGASGTEGEGSSTEEVSSGSSSAESGGSSSSGSSLSVADLSGSTPPLSQAATPSPSSALRAASRPGLRARTQKGRAVSFAPGTLPPAPVTAGALSEEAIGFLRSLSVGQHTMVNAIQDLCGKMTEVVSFLDGIHQMMVAQQRHNQSMASSMSDLAQAVLTIVTPGVSAPSVSAPPSHSKKKRSHKQSHTSSDTSTSSTLSRHRSHRHADTPVSVPPTQTDTTTAVTPAVTQATDTSTSHHAKKSKKKRKQDTSSTHLPALRQDPDTADTQAPAPTHATAPTATATPTPSTSLPLSSPPGLREDDSFDRALVPVCLPKSRLPPPKKTAPPVASVGFQPASQPGTSSSSPPKTDSARSAPTECSRRKLAFTLHRPSRTVTPPPPPPAKRRRAPPDALPFLSSTKPPKGKIPRRGGKVTTPAPTAPPPTTVASVVPATPRPDLTVAVPAVPGVTETDPVGAQTDRDPPPDGSPPPPPTP